MSTLGVDLGTSGVRAAVYDAAGELLASAAVPTALTRSGDRVETDAEAVLTAAETAIRTAVADPAVLDDRVTALSFSVQGEAVVPVDREGRALAAAPVSMDRRGVRAASAIGDRLGGDRVQRITGQPLHPMFSLYKIAEGGPGWADGATAAYRCLDAFVAARLGAEAATDHSMAARTGAFDVGALDWSDELLEAVAADGPRIDRRMLPRAVPAGTVIGAVDAAAAARTGLDSGIAIIAGVHDQGASWLGAGGRRGAVSVFALGSSDCLTVGTDGRPDGLDGTGFASYPLRDGVWLTLAGTAAGGWALDWFSGIVGGDVASVFDAPSATPPELLVLPYLVGSGTLDNDPTARGAVIGLTLDTTRDQLARAFLEAGGFELAKMLDAFAARGVSAGELRAVGSGAANRAGLEARALAAGAPLAPVGGHPSARGAALLAALGTGAADSLDTLPAPETGIPAVPDPDLRAWYDTQRAAYRSLYPATRDLIHPPAPKEHRT